MPPDPPNLFTLKRMQWPYQYKIVGASTDVRLQEFGYTTVYYFTKLLAVILTSQLVVSAMILTSSSVLLYFLSGSCDCCVIKCGYSSGDNNMKITRV